MNWIKIVWDYSQTKCIEMIMNIPDSEINTLDEFGLSLLHIAIMKECKDLVKFLIIHRKVDVNIKNRNGNTPLHLAVMYANIYIIKILTTVNNIDFNLVNNENATPLDIAFHYFKYFTLLIANGARLKTLNKRHKDQIKPNLIAFENGVLKCRSAVVSMLALKRRGLFKNQCRFIIREISIAIWSTRCDPEWQSFFVKK